MIHTYPGDVIAIDTFMHGWPGITAVYYLPGSMPAIIETGPGSSLAKIEQGLDEAGVEDLAWIILTHIHLDHAGAVGHLAKRFPNAKIVVRVEGAPHLVDPSRLWASAGRLYGEMEKLWGEMLPVDEERIIAVDSDGVVADLGDRTIKAVYAPGHAKHQMALWDEGSGDLFTGDAIGVYLPEADLIRPATPPPDFDMEVSIKTVHNLKVLSPRRVFPTHFGPVPDPEAALDEAELRFRQWVGAAEPIFARGGDALQIAEAFRENRDEFYPGLDPALVEKFDNTTSYELNAAGIHRYLRKKAEVQGA